MYITFFQWEASKEERAQVITAGLENPTPDVSRTTVEAEATSKDRHSQFSHLSTNDQSFSSSPITHITFNVSHLIRYR